jgi:uncharacterized protein
VSLRFPGLGRDDNLAETIAMPEQPPRLHTLLTTPALIRGQVYHTRVFLRRHHFAYRAHYLWLPLSQRAACPLLRRGRCAPFALRDRDFGPRTGEDLAAWIWGRLADWGVPLTPETGEVVLVTMPRSLGFGFNPIAFWLCCDRAGNLRAVLNEVHNTFGEQHFYLCRHPDHRPIAAADVLEAEKVFHVSPFFARRGFYRFRYQLSDGEAGRGTLGFHIDYHGPDGTLRLKTGLVGKPQALSHAPLWQTGRQWLLQPLLVWLRIHWQAWRLYRLQIPVRRKPPQKAERETFNNP